MKNITLATIKSIIKNGGATFNNKGVRVQMKTGYQVSKEDLIIIDINTFNKHILKELLKKLSSRGEYLGVWIDSGKVYIDISCRIATKQEAIQIGKKLQQLSILRWRDGACLAIV